MDEWYWNRVLLVVLENAFKTWPSHGHSGNSFPSLGFDATPWNSNVYRESQEEKRPVSGAVALCYVSQHPRKIIRTENSPWVICADEGGGMYSQPKAVLWVGVKSVTTCGGDRGSRLSLPATNKFRMYWLWRVSTEDSTDHSSFWFFYTDAQNFELPRQRGGQKPMGAVWISQDDFMELCQRRFEKRKPSAWPRGTMHLSLERYKPDYRKTGEPKPHILSFLIMPLKKSYCLKIPYFLFLKFICRLWDLVCDLELAIRGGSGSHTEHPPSAKFCELSFFPLCLIYPSIYLPTYLLIYQPPSLAC